MYRAGHSRAPEASRQRLPDTKTFIMICKQRLTHFVSYYAHERESRATKTGRFLLRDWLVSPNPVTGPHL